MHISGRLPHARPKAQRDLMRYLQAAFEAAELERRPVQWKVWRNGVRFRFAGLAPAVWIYFSNHGEIDVGVSCAGTYWDLLYSNGAAIEATANGLYNAFCYSEYQQVYPSRRALLRAETFEPFVQWCKTSLFRSRHLHFYDYGGGTAAFLDVDAANEGTNGYIGQIELWPSTK